MLVARSPGLAFWTGLCLWSAVSCRAAMTPVPAQSTVLADASVRLRDRLERGVWPGVPLKVLDARVMSDRTVGFLVALEVRREDADDARHRDRVDRCQSRLTRALAGWVRTHLPGHRVAGWSSVLLWEAPLAGSSSPRVTRIAPVAGGAVVPVLGGVEVRGARGPTESVQEVVDRTRLADRIRQELAPLYPDVRVSTRTGGPGEVTVDVTALSAAEPDESNRPFVEEYLAHVVAKVAARDCPGLKLSRRSRFRVIAYEVYGAADRPVRDNPLWRSRVDLSEAGMSRILEGRIRRELSVRYPVLDSRVWFLTPREVAVWVRVETAEPLAMENRNWVREFMRRTVLTILALDYPRLRLSARSSFRVDGPGECGRVEMGPVRSRAPGVRRAHPRERVPCPDMAMPVSAVRSRVIELPTAHVVPVGHGQTEVMAFGRTVKSGAYSNVVSLDTRGLDLGYRQGIVPDLEGTFALRNHTQTIHGQPGTTFSPGSHWMSVLSVGLKYRLHPTDNGTECAVGGTASVVSDLDRPILLPDEWQRFRNVYAVVSTPFAPGFRGHLSALAAFVPASSGSPSGTIASAGAGVEWLPFEEVRVLGEVASENLSSKAIGQLGTLGTSESAPRFGGVHANLGLVAGLAELGDLEIYARKIGRSGYGELGAGLFTRF